MTRLTEALERALAMPATPQGQDQTPAVATPTDEQGVPSAWHLDGDPPLADAARPSASPGAPAPLAVKEPEGETAPVAYAFGKGYADKLIVSTGAESVMVEQYRRLAGLLHHAQVESGTRTIMVTSAVAAEGKTLSATNLALTISHSYQRRVLLIDADLRRPSLHEMFQLPNDSGVGNILRRSHGGPLPLHRVSPTLWVLTAGRPVADPMSGLVSDSMKHLLADAAEQFDWVVVDTPPVALLSDANLLAGMIDVALIVVGANTTPYPLVKKAIEAIGASRVLGVILNRADRSTMAGEYGYYYGYGYGYGYGSRPERRYPV
jgi:capsular exopolysaccharide synthesis family protein